LLDSTAQPYTVTPSAETVKENDCLCDRSSAIALMRALVMTLSCYGALEIVCVLLLLFFLLLY